MIRGPANCQDVYFCTQTMKVLCPDNVRHWSSNPIISSTFIQQYSLPTINQDIPLWINGADGCIMPGAGEAFTYTLMLEHK
jgi:hypothetical protein